MGRRRQRAKLWRKRLRAEPEPLLRTRSSPALCPSPSHTHTHFSGDVLLTARDEARGKAAVQQLQAEGLSPRFHQLDIDDRQSIRALRDFLRKEYGGLDVLVNNAGIAFKCKPWRVERGGGFPRAWCQGSSREHQELPMTLFPSGTLHTAQGLYHHLTMDQRFPGWQKEQAPLETKRGRTCRAQQKHKKREQIRHMTPPEDPNPSVNELKDTK
ncbi:hypothetical protein A6R68_15848, partial [Neotoma lepida]